eukprot:3824187-Prymnesium_polylepis.1
MCIRDRDHGRSDGSRATRACRDTQGLAMLEGRAARAPLGCRGVWASGQPGRKATGFELHCGPYASAGEPSGVAVPEPVATSLSLTCSAVAQSVASTVTLAAGKRGPKTTPPELRVSAKPPSPLIVA